MTGDPWETTATEATSTFDLHKIMAEDFLAREQAVLGSAFLPTGGANSLNGEIDFTAASFPALDEVDGDSLSAFTGTSNGLFDFDITPSASKYEVKVTGGDVEVERFENDFPSLDNVRTSSGIDGIAIF